MREAVSGGFEAEHTGQPDGAAFFAVFALPVFFRLICHISKHILVYTEVGEDERQIEDVLCEIQTAKNGRNMPTVAEVANSPRFKFTDEETSPRKNRFSGALDAAASAALAVRTRKPPVRRQKQSFGSQLYSITKCSVIQFSRAKQTKLLDLIITLVGGLIVGAVNLHKIGDVREIPGVFN